MNKFRRFLKNPWTILIAGTALATLCGRWIDKLTGSNILNSILDIIKSIVIGVVKFFTNTYQSPLWFLILLFLLGIFLTLITIWIIVKLGEAKEKSLPKFLSFKEARFGRLLYRWDYYEDYGGEYKVTDIRVLCPTCICLLVNLECPNCNNYYDQLIKNDSEVEALIIHRIESQKINERS
jgi:hypothetical protein